MIVVAGSPRSGTSLAMQLLVAGGLTPAIDQETLNPQLGNVYGSFELNSVFNPAHSIRTAADLARNKNLCVKILNAPLIPILEAGVLPAAIIMTYRAPEKVRSSHAASLGNESPSSEELSIVRDKLRSMVQDISIPLFDVDIEKLVKEPKKISREVALFVRPFITISLDVDKMAQTPDSDELHF